MISELGSATHELVKLALSAASLKQHMIAGNIANANTQGYHPVQLDFRQILEQASISAENLSQDKVLKEKLTTVNVLLKDGSGMIQTTGPVALDQEMTQMAQNLVLYHTLLTGLGRLGEITKMAISERGEV